MATLTGPAAALVAERAVAAEDRALARIEATAQAQARDAWRVYVAVGTAAAAARFADDMAAIVRRAQVLAGQSAAQAVGLLTTLLTGIPRPAVPIAVPDAVRGVPLATVYTRPPAAALTSTLRRLPADQRAQARISATATVSELLSQVDTADLAELLVLPDQPTEAELAEIDRDLDGFDRGLALDLEAAYYGEKRLRTVVHDDVALAARWGRWQVLSTDDRVTGWRRVPRPELSKSGVCGLCLAASTRIYKRGDLLPLHGGCNCTQLPVVTSPGGTVSDPGLQLNKDDLARIYAAAGDSTATGDLLQTAWTVDEHGELGPVLRSPKHRHQGPAEVADTEPLPSTPQRITALIGALDQTYADLQQRAAAGEDVNGPLTYQGRRLTRLRDGLDRIEPVA